MELDRILRWLEELERAELTKLLRRPPRDTVAEATSAARAAAASRNLDAWLRACRGAAAGNAPEPRDARRLCKTALRSLAAREFVPLLAPPPPRRADACWHGFSSVASTHGACCYALEALSALRLPPEQLKQATQMQLVLCRGLADACLRLAEPRLDVAEHAIALARERCDTAEEAACARLLAAGTRLLARRLTRPGDAAERSELAARQAKWVALANSLDARRAAATGRGAAVQPVRVARPAPATMTRTRGEATATARRPTSSATATLTRSRELTG